MYLHFLWLLTSSPSLLVQTLPTMGLANNAHRKIQQDNWHREQDQPPTCLTPPTAGTYLHQQCPGINFFFIFLVRFVLVGILMLFYSECLYALILKINIQSFPSIVSVLKLLERERVCVCWGGGCVSKDRNSINGTRFTLRGELIFRQFVKEVFLRVTNKRIRRGKQDREGEEAIQGYDSI